MSHVEWAPEVADDFDPLWDDSFDHLFAHGAGDAPGHIRDIIAAIDVLESGPSIGRPAGRAGIHRRELVIGRGSRGQVALYRYVEGLDTVFVLTARSQRKAGVSRP